MTLIRTKASRPSPSVQEAIRERSVNRDPFSLLSSRKTPAKPRKVLSAFPSSLQNHENKQTKKKLLRQRHG